METVTEYLAVLEREGESWGAYCPDLPGLGVVGNSRDEVEKLVREAIPFHIEGLRESGDPVPEPAATDAVLVQIS
jgi:predicted RNase H-like HicB family nuclease